MVGAVVLDVSPPYESAAETVTIAIVALIIDVLAAMAKESPNCERQGHNVKNQLCVWFRHRIEEVLLLVGAHLKETLSLERQSYTCEI
jgi:hypothetical protein